MLAFRAPTPVDPVVRVSVAHYDPAAGPATVAPSRWPCFVGRRKDGVQKNQIFWPRASGRSACYLSDGPNEWAATEPQETSPRLTRPLKPDAPVLSSCVIKGTDEQFRRAAYSAMTRQMPENGLHVVMFAHQDAGVWADLGPILGRQGQPAWNDFMWLPSRTRTCDHSINSPLPIRDGV